MTDIGHPRKFDSNGYRSISREVLDQKREEEQEIKQEFVLQLFEKSLLHPVHRCSSHHPHTHHRCDRSDQLFSS